MGRAEPQNVQVDADVEGTRRCDNPLCSKRFKWSERPGRPQIFHDPICAKRARAAAALLVDEIAQHEARLRESSLTYRERRLLLSELAQRRWLFSGYPRSTWPTGATMIDVD